MANPLLDFLGSLLGGIPSQPGAAPTPGFGNIAGPTSPGVTAPQVAPGQHYGVMDVLASPGAEGILSSYFSLLAQPRAGGWARGLGAAGLSGLQGFEQAREQQLKLPLEQAQLGEALAKTKLTGAQATEEEAKSKWLSGLPSDQQALAFAPDVGKAQMVTAGNHMTAIQLEAAATNPRFAPDEQQRFRTVAATVRQAPQYISPADAFKLAYTDPTLAGRKDLADIAEKQARTQYLGAEKGLIPLREQQLRASTAASQARANVLRGAGALTSKDLDAVDREARQEADSVIGKPKPPAPPGRFEEVPLVGGTYARAMQEYQDQQQRWTQHYNDAYARKVAQRQARRGAAFSAAGAPEEGPAGAARDIPSTWTEEPLTGP